MIICIQYYEHIFYTIDYLRINTHFELIVYMYIYIYLYAKKNTKNIHITGDEKYILTCLIMMS